MSGSVKPVVLDRQGEAGGGLEGGDNGATDRVGVKRERERGVSKPVQKRERKRANPLRLFTELQLEVIHKNEGSSHLALQSARGEARVAATAPAMTKNLASMLDEGYSGINQRTSIEQSESCSLSTEQRISLTVCKDACKADGW